MSRGACAPGRWAVRRITSRIALAGDSFGDTRRCGRRQAAHLIRQALAIQRLPAALSERYTGGGADAAALHDGAIKAVVAIAPAGGAPWAAWGRFRAGGYSRAAAGGCGDVRSHGGI